MDQGEVERACAAANRSRDLTETISSHRSTGLLRDLSKGASAER
ncbi:hypothetical protein [Streptomyces sp. NPDC002547]